MAGLASVEDVELEAAVRTRRTHKAYGADPVERETLDALLELARWAPNHHLTNPWRFRVLGPESLDRLKEAADPTDAVKLDRAPTLVVASVVVPLDDPLQAQEELCAGACAAYIVLLAAHGRGLAGYWRTPGVLRRPEGLAAVGVPAEEQVLGLLHLGRPRQERTAPVREPPERYVTYLA